eukprot:m.10377 g.10377  ORF g.10377 m.10377 type:complete len:78 (-) comp6580_c0_seq2:86-319(-)
MGGLKVDPAIERWGSMRETSARHFKVTRTAARNGLIWGLVVPLALYELSIVEFVSFICSECCGVLVLLLLLCLFLIV